MNNEEFLNCILNSFKTFLITDSRSNKKLKVLHGGIANDIISRLGNDYQIKSLGYEKGKESNLEGRYLHKKVDITILKNDIPLGGISVKYVMQNYSQNSVNYFENMLGETANIRSNGIPYFQIFIISDKIPYFKKEGKFQKWESFSLHNVKKYLTLSRDKVENFFHTPTKTLLFVIKLPEIDKTIKNKKEYFSYYNNLKNLKIQLTEIDYGKFHNSVVFNDYDSFIQKVVHYIQSI